jgi:hypothetical protein
MQTDPSAQLGQGASHLLDRSGAGQAGGGTGKDRAVAQQYVTVMWIFTRSVTYCFVLFCLLILILFFCFVLCFFFFCFSFFFRLTRMRAIHAR